MVTQNALAGLVGSVALIAVIGCRPNVGPPQTGASSQPPVEAGVYGFSGAGVPMEEPEGVIGDCIWIFDEADHRQVAKAECQERAPGRYRLVLAPGHYVLRGPGGAKPIEIKPGAWLEIDSIAALPLAP